MMTSLDLAFCLVRSLAVYQVAMKLELWLEPSFPRMGTGRATS
jgi:hypothetical protein